MGKKKDKPAQKQLKKRTRRMEKLAKTMCSPKGCKPDCCEKFRKGEHKRCKKCPCFDLLKELRKKSEYQQVA